MKYFYIKPVMLGILGGISLLIIYFLVIYGLVAVFDTGVNGGNDAVTDPLHPPTPTPIHEPNEVLIVLFIVLNIVTPILMGLIGAVSVRLASTDKLTLLQLMYVSAFPGALSISIPYLTIGLLNSVAANGSQPIIYPDLLYNVIIIAPGIACSIIGGVIYGAISNKIKS
ncbi:hypothetical protein CUJ83_12915 [Methanocella sp. CWC-04]|uniref:Uncharacterized protein n=1 Tax=Methanooceanicella nereidis TaxID=2052831 RepID=A0AAP2RF00_9EURY|nr:hypothetical protein [Methanocella sp. CWC-04]MCD1295897.1 hypothetical protein [Methanocella sp. CWC-04]